MTAAHAVAGEALDARATWTPRVFLAGLALLLAGTLLVVLGVLAPGALLPGIVILDVAMLLLAAAGILRAITPDG